MRVKGTIWGLLLGCILFFGGCQNTQDPPFEVAERTVKTESELTTQTTTETKVETTTVPLIEAYEAKTIPIIAFNGQEIDFTSSEEQVQAVLGLPYDLASVNDVTRYRYTDQPDIKYPKVSSFYFVDHQLCSIEIECCSIDGPRGIRCGEPFAKVIRIFASQNQLTALGIEKTFTDAEILKQLVENGVYDLTFDLDEQFKLYVKISTKDAKDKILEMKIFKSSQFISDIEITKSDFSAKPIEIIKKFGYPNTIGFYPPYSVSFIYNKGATYETENTISLLNETFVHSNNFRIKQDWKTEFGLRVGQEKAEVENILGQHFFDDSRYSATYEHGNLNYIIYGQSNDNRLASFSICRETVPEYDIQKKQPKDFILPQFDPNQMASCDDMYLSELGFGSSRLDVFSRLGTPIKVINGFDEVIDNYQYCVYALSYFVFRSVEDAINLDSGSAYYCSVNDPNLVGPRGLKVGDPIEKFLDVFPGLNDIDFKNVKGPRVIYEKEPGSEADFAKIIPDLESNQPNSGTIHLTIEWYLGINFNYENGVITEINLTQMLD